MSELKPCPNPWCFSMMAPVPVRQTNGNGNPCGWRVMCACGVRTFRADTRHDAIAAWNRRNPVSGDREAVARIVADALTSATAAVGRRREYAAGDDLPFSTTQAIIALLSPKGSEGGIPLQPCADGSQEPVLTADAEPPAQGGVS